MILPPMVLKVDIEKRSGRGFTLWIPLFIFWPFLLVVFILELPFLLLAAVLALLTIVGSGRVGRLPRLILLMLAVPRFFAIYWALRGLLIDVRNTSEHVHISVK